MSQTRDNGGVVPVNSDAYNLTADLASFADSLSVITNVISQAQRDALTKYNGRTVRRLDIAQAPLQWWDNSASIWRSHALGQIASAATAAGANVVGISLNNLLEVTPTVETGRLIEVRAYIDGSASVNSMYVAYTLARGGTGTSGTPIRTATKAYAIAGNGEGMELSARYTTTAAGPLRFNLQGQVTVPATGTQTMTGQSSLTITDLGMA